MYDGRRFGSLLWSAVLTLFGLLAVTISVRGIVGELRTYNALHTRGVETDAVVIEVLFREHGLPSGKSYEVVIEFDAGRGVVHEQLAVRGTSAEGVEVGARLRVTYDRTDPRNVELAESARSPHLWWQAGALLGGILGASVGITILTKVVRRRITP
jgi:hypothetical protein